MTFLNWGPVLHMQLKECSSLTGQSPVCASIHAGQHAAGLPWWLMSCLCPPGPPVTFQQSFFPVSQSPVFTAARVSAVAGTRLYICPS